MWLLSAFALGLVSSLHCVGMCGPLVLSVARGRPALFGYHFGRIGVYALLGMVAGLFGRGVRLAGFQQVFSISLGVVILVVLFGGWKAGVPGLYALVGRLWRWESRMKFVVLGMANGLLPCGMVYLALAVSSTGVGEAVGFMVFFGMGTLPLLLGVSVFSRYMGVSMRGRLRKVLPVVVASVGVLLILRGMGLGIPWVSPVLPAGAREAISCH